MHIFSHFLSLFLRKLTNHLTVHDFVPSIQTFPRTAENWNCVYLNRHLSIFVNGVLIKLCENKLVSDWLIFFQFCKSLSELDFSPFFNTVVKITVFKHFLKLLFWNLENLAFWAFTFCCQKSLRYVEDHLLLSKVVARTDHLSLDVHLNVNAVFSALFWRSQGRLDWVRIVTFENNLTF